jgi:hypothetical protein
MVQASPEQHQTKAMMDDLKKKQEELQQNL